MRICQSKTTRVRKWKRKISKLDKDIRDKTSATLNRSELTSLSPRKITEKPYSVKCLSKGPGEAFSSHCWFAREVTAAILEVKNKSISLLW